MLLLQFPRTVVLSTDIFDEFMEQNNLYSVALSELSDNEILNRFLKLNSRDMYTRTSMPFWQFRVISQ